MKWLIFIIIMIQTGYRFLLDGIKNGTLTVAEPLILKNVDYNVIFLSNF